MIVGGPRRHAEDPTSWLVNGLIVYGAVTAVGGRWITDREHLRKQAQHESIRRESLDGALLDSAHLDGLLRDGIPALTIHDGAG